MAVWLLLMGPPCQPLFLLLVCDDAACLPVETAVVHHLHSCSFLLLLLHLIMIINIVIYCYS